MSKPNNPFDSNYSDHLLNKIIAIVIEDCEIYGLGEDTYIDVSSRLQTIVALRRILEGEE